MKLRRSWRDQPRRKIPSLAPAWIRDAWRHSRRTVWG